MKFQSITDTIVAFYLDSGHFVFTITDYILLGIAATPDTMVIKMTADASSIVDDTTSQSMKKLNIRNLLRDCALNSSDLSHYRDTFLYLCLIADCVQCQCDSVHASYLVRMDAK